MKDGTSWKTVYQEDPDKKTSCFVMGLLMLAFFGCGLSIIGLLAYAIFLAIQTLVC